ncbi:MAG: ACT domain-containing protein [Pseudomonadota bacterium]|nr:ACT domain-containing protein [Pseudomonadota bacterium]MEC8525621.1 ACT domain-containing protein [Pseudomonadota bacterium]
MPDFLVLTVIADDKPGIVEQLSTVIADHGGNWLESRMAQMAGKFAGILRISIDGEQKSKLVAALSSLDSSGLQVRVETPAAEKDTLATHSLALSVVGNDRPGIVREVSQALARIGVNVLELSTQCEPAEMSAVPLFRSEISASIPDSLDHDDVREVLEALSDDLMVELH